MLYSSIENHSQERHSLFPKLERNEGVNDREVTEKLGSNGLELTK
jgi:hypothetical protein